MQTKKLHKKDLDMVKKDTYHGFEVVSERVNILDVKIIKASFMQTSDVHKGKKSVNIKRKVHVQVDKEKNLIFVVIDFTLNGMIEGIESPVIEIESSFLLVYSITDCENLTESAYQEFGEVNAVYNVWPYWREYVQNATTRMGLQSLTIPVFKIIKKTEEAKKITTKKASKKKVSKKVKGEEDKEKR